MFNICLGPPIHLWSVKGIVILACVIIVALVVGHILGKDEQTRRCKSELDEQSKTIKDQQTRRCKSELDEQTRRCTRELDEQSKTIKDKQSRRCKNELDEQTRRCTSKLEGYEVISAQVELIMKWKRATKEIIRVINEYIEDVVQYCELKEKKARWFDSLSDKEKFTMKRLQDKIGDVDFPTKEVRSILDNIRDQLKQSLDRKLSDLEDSLHDLPWKIKQMKRQQANLSEKEISKFLKSLEEDWRQEFDKAQI